MSDPVRPSKTPRYLEIFEALRADIGSGEFAIGALLPSEASLCARFAVSRFTVREALRRLQSDGMLSRIQGAGSRVLRDAPSGIFVQNYRSISDLTQYAAETELELLKIEDRLLDDDLAERLGQKAGETWVLLRALRRTPEGAPLALVESYVAQQFKEIVPDLVRGNGPIYLGLAKVAGVAIDRVDQETQALPAPYHVAEALGLAEHAPTLRILRRYATASSLLIASFNWHYGGDRYIHRTRISLGSD
jgi:GntR family transcriptional regulator